MPEVVIHPPLRNPGNETPSPLPQLLRTPSGLALVELQGTVSTSGLENDESESNLATALTLGRLVFPAYDAEHTSLDGQGSGWDGKRVFLYVGQHQRMTGEVKKLAKPIAIVQRHDGGGNNDGNADVEELKVAEIIYHKVLFAHRPEPMGGQQQQQLDP